MISQELIAKIYHSQGTNHKESNPDGVGYIGGGCNSASIINGIRLVTSDIGFGIRNIEEILQGEGIPIIDNEFAAKIPTVAIPLVAAKMLPNKHVSLLHKGSFEEHIAANSGSYWGSANIYVYKKIELSELTNLDMQFKVDVNKQLELLIDTLLKGGIGIPLVDMNLLYEFENQASYGFTHLVDVLEYDIQSNSFRILDSNPGSNHMSASKELMAGHQLKWRNGRFSYEQATQIAKVFHPKHSVDFWVTASCMKNSHRGLMTLVN